MTAQSHSRQMISIHAPAWGRPLNLSPEVRRTIFQFTPPRGGDGRQIFSCPPLTYFNSRPRVGATLCHLPGQLSRKYFNSRPRVGATFHMSFSTSPSHISIHAPAWGRLTPDWAALKPQYISIHAPAWGRPKQRSFLLAPQTISIHAPAWGRQALCNGAVRQILISIHAPAWGRLLHYGDPSALHHISIHAPAWGRPAAPL